MKKILNNMVMMVAALGVLWFASCSISAGDGDDSGSPSQSSSSVAGGQRQGGNSSALVPEKPLTDEKAGEPLWGEAFEGCGYQVWQGFSCDPETGLFRLTGGDWWGGAFGAYNNGMGNGDKYDMSAITKITFDAKATSEITVGFTAGGKDVTKTDFVLGTEYESYTYDVGKLGELGTNASILAVAGGSAAGEKFYLKNVTFYDADDNVVAPELLSPDEITDELEDAPFWKSFAGCGVQPWDNTVMVDPASGLVTVITEKNWWGVGFGANDNGMPNGNRYDMSKVAKITFTAKASRDGMVLKVSAAHDDKNGNTQKFTLTDSYTDYELVTTSLSEKAMYVIVLAGGEDPFRKIYVKNIAFFDKDGAEISPELVTPDEIKEDELSGSGFWKSFGGAGVQIWDNTFGIDFATGAISIRAEGHWWGGSFGAYEGGASAGYGYDMSGVKKITFSAKASRDNVPLTMYMNEPDDKKTKFTLTTEYQDCVYTLPEDFGLEVRMFSFTGGDDGLVQLYIKNVEFYDEDGNVVVPEGKTLDIGEGELAGHGFWHTFGGCGFQIWENTFKLDGNSGQIWITGEWWGGAFGSYNNGQEIKGQNFDTSEIAKITFTARGEDKEKVWMYFGAKEDETRSRIEVELTPEYVTYVLPIKTTIEESTLLFCLGGGRNNGQTIYIKDVSFFNAEGEEISPALKEE